MGNNVFANGREVSCKAADGKAICAFPDVCMTPPENPATPPGVPIPYPNTGKAKDAAAGSKKVKISKKEIMLKNQSHFKKSMGDEAGSAAKKGVITSVNRGKIYFTSWSMDVKFEGKNVVRHLDMTTHNHASAPGQTPPWPYNDSAAPAKGPCKGQPKKCKMTPYKPDKCPKGKTGHHAVPAHCYMAPTARSQKMADRNKMRYKGTEKYRVNKGLVICVDGASKEGTHGEIHELFDAMEDNPKHKGVWTAKQAENAAVKSVSEVTGCDPKCIRAQIRHNHKEMGIDDKTQLRADSTGRRDTAKKPKLTRKVSTR